MAVYYDNIFEAVTKRPSEVFELTLRADLLDTVLSVIRERRLDAKQTGEILCIPAPRVSELMHGKIALMSSAKLIGYLGLLGYQLKPALDAEAGVICPVRKIEQTAA